MKRRSFLQLGIVSSILSIIPFQLFKTKGSNIKIKNNIEFIQNISYNVNGVKHRFVLYRDLTNDKFVNQIGKTEGDWSEGKIYSY